MPIHITVSAYLRRHTQGQAAVEVSGSTVRTAIDDLISMFPEVHRYLFHPGDDSQVRRFMHVYLNGREVRSSNELAAPISSGDELVLIPDVA
jgi:sulfur-carrier protein